jgi:predicted nucleic acid-binding protein
MHFVDTNVLLYSISFASEEAEKARIAVSLLETDDLVLSVQVLQEFYVQAVRPTRTERLTHQQATAFIQKWLRFRVQAITVRVLQSALAIKERHGLSYWDSAILAAAQAAGCDKVWSEDLAHGRHYESLCVINPFL